MNKQWILCIFLLFSFTFFGCKTAASIEDLDIIIGLGFDLAPGLPNEFEGSAEYLVYKENREISRRVSFGITPTIYSRESLRQAKANKKAVRQSEMAYIISEERARYGIIDILDSIIRDPMGNKKAYVAVSGPKAKDILLLTGHSTATMSETISGMIRYAYQDNFFSDKLTIGSFLTMFHQEGRNIVLPYIVASKEGSAEIRGLALFKDDKMLHKTSLDEARLMNLLRNNNTIGHLNVETEDPVKYAEMFCKNKLKVKVSKEDNRLKYDIFVTLIGELKLDTMNNATSSVKPGDLDKIKEKFQEKYQRELSYEVRRLQQDYGVDWLDLGQYAAAKYGRGKGYDSDKNFQEAKIDVHVIVKIKSTGSTT